MLDEPCFEIDSSSEVIPRKSEVQLRMRKNEKRVLTPQVANDLADKNFDFQSDSSDLLSLESDLNVDLSSEVKPSKKNVRVNTKKKTKNPLSPTNIPDVSHASDLLSEAGESSESCLNEQSFEFLSNSSVSNRRSLGRSSSAAIDNQPVKERGVTLKAGNGSNSKLDSERKVQIAQIAAMSYAIYETYHKGQ